MYIAEADNMEPMYIIENTSRAWKITSRYPLLCVNRFRHRRSWNARKYRDKMLGMKNHFDISGSIEIRKVDIAGVACTYHFLPKSHSSKLRIFLYILYIFGKPPWNERKISLMPFWNLSHVWVTETHLLNPKWKQYLKWIYTSRLDCMGKKLRDYHDTDHNKRFGSRHFSPVYTIPCSWMLM